MCQRFYRTVAAAAACHVHTLERQHEWRSSVNRGNGVAYVLNMISAPISPSCPAEPIISSRQNPLPFWKRALDFVLLIFLVPALLPIMVAIAAMIKLLSRGPVFFAQERIGYQGEPFTCLKFRTMRAGADCSPHEQYVTSLLEDLSAPTTKLDENGDDRIFPLGRVLRASGLDELPQVINILKGEMSFVGPRPCMRYEYVRFSSEDCRRFHAVPGITGLWQVSGKNETTYKEMIALDVRYARRLSIRDDLAILFRTFPVVFRQTFKVLTKPARSSGK